MIVIHIDVYLRSPPWYQVCFNKSSKMRETCQLKFEQKTIKNKIVMEFFRCNQSKQNWQLCIVHIQYILWVPLPCYSLYTHTQLKNAFSLQKMFNHMFTLNIIIANMFLYNPCMRQINSIINFTKKIEVYEIECTEQIGEDSGRYAQCLQFVSHRWQLQNS